MEKDNSKKGPMAVYHYSASSTSSGRLFDGVIIRPVIFSDDCYHEVRHEIARRVGVGFHNVQVQSLSFVGETIPK